MHEKSERASKRASARELCATVAATYKRIWKQHLQKTIKHYVSTVFISIGCSVQVNNKDRMKMFFHVFRLIQLHLRFTFDIHCSEINQFACVCDVRVYKQKKNE